MAFIVDYVSVNPDIFHSWVLFSVLRSMLQQLLVSITFPNFLDAGEFPST